MKELLLLLAIISVPFLLLKLWGKLVLKRDNKKQFEFDKVYSNARADIIFYTPDKQDSIDAKIQMLEKLSFDTATKEKIDVLKDELERKILMSEEDRVLDRKIDEWGKKKFRKESTCEICGHKNEEICNTCPDLPGKPEHIEDYPVFDKEYLNECIKKATPNLSKIKDVDKELGKIRGTDCSVNKREFTNRSDMDEVDQSFLSHIQ